MSPPSGSLPSIIVAVAMLSACVGPELSEDLSDIRVYEARPTCRYQSLGPIEARDGHRGSANAAVWSARGSEENAMQRLKLAARDKGANALILVYRDVKQRPKDSRSVSKRPARLVILRGIAIRDCDA